MLASARASGPRLVPSASVKVKAIEYGCPQGGLWSTVWTQGWTTNPVASSLVTSQLTQIKAQGANTTKVTIEPPAAGTFPDDATYRVRRQLFFNECRRIGVKLYVNLAGTNANVFYTSGVLDYAKVAASAAFLATLDQDAGDIIIGIDLINEMNGAFASSAGWGDITTVNQKARTDLSIITIAHRSATTIPITASVCITKKVQLATSPWTDLQYDMSFAKHDIHLYYQDAPQSGGYSASGEFPLSSDLVSLESRTKFLGRHLIGEQGCALTAGPVLQGRYFDGIGDVARRPLSHGAIMFLLTDFDTTYRYGMYDSADTTFSTPRTGMTVPFSKWIGSI